MTRVSSSVYELAVRSLPPELGRGHMFDSPDPLGLGSVIRACGLPVNGGEVYWGFLSIVIWEKIFRPLGGC